MKKVLLTEDDDNLAFMINEGLEAEGYEVLHKTNGEDVIASVATFCPDIILLDVNLKGQMNGFEASKKVRQICEIPIIFISSRTLIDDVQEGFKIGNVDYLKKPFGIRELILRMNELLFRNEKNGTSINSIAIGNFLFFPTEHILQTCGVNNHLQKNECAVLSLLCENKGKVMAKKTILEAVWTDDVKSRKDASLHNIISTLRNKLSQDNRIEIQTVSKVGYRLVIKLT